MVDFKTKVNINSVTVKDSSAGGDLKLILSWEYQRRSDNSISELDMRALQSINDTVTLAVGQTVEIWGGFTTSTDVKLFDGYLGEFTPQGGSTKIRCYDKAWDLIRKNVNNIYLDDGAQAGQISAIAKDLIETYGGMTSDEEATGTALGETISEFRCRHTDIWERLTALARAVNYQVFYDPVNDTVHFESKGFTDSGQTLTVGDEIIGVPDWENDTSQMINDLRVDGAVIETDIRKPTTSPNAGQIDTTADFDTDEIVLDKTPESVQLMLDAANPPTQVKEGGSQDALTGN